MIGNPGTFTWTENNLMLVRRLENYPLISDSYFIKPAPFLWLCLKILPFLGFRWQLLKKYLVVQLWLYLKWAVYDQWESIDSESLNQMVLFRATILGGGGGKWIDGRTGVCHFGSWSDTQKFNFHIKILSKHLFYKILHLLFQYENYASPIQVYQVKMASILWQVAKIN